MSKKGENIYKRRDGRWEGRYIYARRNDGSAVYRSIYGKTYIEVKQKLLGKREEVRRRELQGCTLTIRELAGYWLQNNAESIKPSSLARYRLLTAKHIIPELGDIAVCDLTAEALNGFITRKLRSGRLDGSGGLSTKTVNDIHCMIKSILKLARKFGYNSHETDDIAAPAVKRRKVSVFTQADTRKITNAALRAPDSGNIAILLSLEFGLRLGEVCALKWSDVDFADGLLYIRRTAIRINYGGHTQLSIQTPKSDSSERCIPLTAKMLTLLRNARGGAQDDEFILTGSAARPMEPRTLQYRFRSFLQRQGIAVRGFHTLRHSFATRCVECGIDAKTLSEILGHSNVRTTLQMYVHPSMAVKRHYMELVSVCA